MKGADRNALLSLSQAEAAAASLCVLARAFAAAAPGPVPRSAPPLLQPLKVSSTSDHPLMRQSPTPVMQPF